MLVGVLSARLPSGLRLLTMAARTANKAIEPMTMAIASGSDMQTRPRQQRRWIEWA